MHNFWTALFGAVAAIWIVQSARAVRGMLRVPWLANAPEASDAAAPSVSVIFAARDEAANLPEALATLLAQDYPRYEVVAVNDRSQDGTQDILREFARTSNRLKVIDLAELPQGWLGKPHALMRGAQQATGEWLVFTDADVHFAPHVLRRALGLASERKWDHLSLFSGFDLSGFWEITTITFFCLGFVFGNEPWLASDRRSGRYVGIGAFQLLRRSVYDAIGGHAALAMEVVEDMKLGKLVKRGGFSSGLGIALESVRLRWYSGAGNIVRGLTKNMFAATGFSLPVAVGGIMLTIVMSILPFLGVVFATGWARIFAGIAALVALAFHAGVARRAKVSPWYGLTHPLGAALFAYIIARSAAVTLARGGIVWRGTFYKLKELRRGSV
ncbi:MAG TPA: glycosyltransferase family 2 protein [Candidatus Acidoferrales bacterium]